MNLSVLHRVHLAWIRGAAKYSLDIVVPPGRAGMEPKLTVEYNSNGGNGYLGKGWGIGGLSVIGRCPRTKAVDGYIKGVDFNNDAYCLDGGTEYRTQKDNYAKVVAYADNGHGPEYWRVWTKSGLVYEYGNTADSRVVIGNLDEKYRALPADQAAISWAVNKITDRTADGNAINFIYNNAGENERYIKEIDYTGGKVVFTYMPRNPQITGYMYGRSYKLT